MIDKGGFYIIDCETFKDKDYFVHGPDAIAAARASEEKRRHDFIIEEKIQAVCGEFVKTEYILHCFPYTKHFTLEEAIEAAATALEPDRELK